MIRCLECKDIDVPKILKITEEFNVPTQVIEDEYEERFYILFDTVFSHPRMQYECLQKIFLENIGVRFRNAK